MRGHATKGLPAGVTIVVLSGVLVAGLGGCTKSDEVATRPEAVALQAAVVRVAESSWPRVVATQGNLVADETTVVGSKIAGRIEHVAVDLGDYVEQGRVVAALDRDELLDKEQQAEAELLQARAAIGLGDDDDLEQLDPHNSPVVVEQKTLWDQALADRDRIVALRKRQAATDAQYEAVVTAERVAKARHAASLNSVRQNIAVVRVRTAQLELARQQLSDAEIRAPFHGRIRERHVSPGAYVQLGDPIVTLIRDDPLRYRGSVPEPYASSIAIGQRVKLRIATGPELPVVTISRISPALDPFSRSLTFEALVPNGEQAIQAGQFSQGEVLLDQTRQAIAVPKSAVVEFAGTRKVWKVVDGEAVEQSIEIGHRREDLVEILSGVEPGDQLLLDGAAGRPGRVEIQKVVAAVPPDEPVPPVGAAPPDEAAPPVEDVGFRSSTAPR